MISIQLIQLSVDIARPSITGPLILAWLFFRFNRIIKHSRGARVRIERSRYFAYRVLQLQ